MPLIFDYNNLGTKTFDGSPLYEIGLVEVSISRMPYLHCLVEVKTHWGYCQFVYQNVKKNL